VPLDRIPRIGEFWTLRYAPGAGNDEDAEFYGLAGKVISITKKQSEDRDYRYSLVLRYPNGDWTFPFTLDNRKRWHQQPIDFICPACHSIYHSLEDYICEKCA
jgi:hypothetical protein